MTTDGSTNAEMGQVHRDLTLLHHSARVSPILRDAVQRVEAEFAVLESLVNALFAAESVDMEHRQFIYRSGPQDWDAEPMSPLQYDTLQRVYFGGEGQRDDD